MSVAEHLLNAKVVLFKELLWFTWWFLSLLVFCLIGEERTNRTHCKTIYKQTSERGGGASRIVR